VRLRAVVLRICRFVISADWHRISVQIIWGTNQCEGF
jgi:hypothetical protein